MSEAGILCDHDAGSGRWSLLTRIDMAEDARQSVDRDI